MVSTFGRGAAACGLNWAISYQQRRLWVRVPEKGGEFHEMPCRDTLAVQLLAFKLPAHVRSGDT